MGWIEGSGEGKEVERMLNWVAVAVQTAPNTGNRARHGPYMLAEGLIQFNGTIRISRICICFVLHTTVLPYVDPPGFLRPDGVDSNKGWDWFGSISPIERPLKCNSIDRTGQGQRRERDRKAPHMVG